MKHFSSPNAFRVGTAALLQVATLVGWASHAAAGYSVAPPNLPRKFEFRIEGDLGADRLEISLSDYRLNEDRVSLGLTGGAQSNREFALTKNRMNQYTRPNRFNGNLIRVKLLSRDTSKRACDILVPGQRGANQQTVFMFENSAQAPLVVRCRVRAEIPDQVWDFETSYNADRSVKVFMPKDAAGTRPLGTTVIVGGLGAPLSDKDSLAERIVKTGQRVITYDLLGQGVHQVAGSAFNNTAGQGNRFSRYADQLAWVIATYAAGDRVTLVGHSLGGAISVIYTARRPDQVKSLALINPYTGLPGLAEKVVAVDMKNKYRLWIYPFRTLQVATRAIEADPNLQGQPLTGDRIADIVARRVAVRECRWKTKWLVMPSWDCADKSMDLSAYRSQLAAAFRGFSQFNALAGPGATLPLLSLANLVQAQEQLEADDTLHRLIDKPLTMFGAKTRDPVTPAARLEQYVKLARAEGWQIPLRLMGERSIDDLAKDLPASARPYAGHFAYLIEAVQTEAARLGFEK